MKDDAERAGECLRATPHDPNENCGRPNVVFARCTCDRHIRAMVAFAQQPEGWREALKPFADLADEMERVAAQHGTAPSEIMRRAPFDACLRARAMLDVAPIPGEE